MSDVLLYVLLSLLTFVVNSILLLIYFSALTGYSSKVTFQKEALKIALPGTAVGSVFIFLNPFLPKFRFGPLASAIDIGITISVVLWTVLSRRYSGAGWLSALVFSAVAAILYLFVMFLVYCFLYLTIQSIFV